jgi:hypothetical protein
MVVGGGAWGPPLDVERERIEREQRGFRAGRGILAAWGGAGRAVDDCEQAAAVPGADDEDAARP